MEYTPSIGLPFMSLTPVRDWLESKKLKDRPVLVARSWIDQEARRLKSRLVVFPNTARIAQLVMDPRRPYPRRSSLDDPFKPTTVQPDRK